MWSLRSSTFAALALVAVAAGPYDGWAPHEYCNDLDRIASTKITPLTPEQAARVEALVQVQIVARHGGRAPYARVFCWDGAHHNPVDAVWNCTTSEVSSQDIGYKSSTGYGRLYGKTYMDHTNLLNGTCTIGGLLPTGREQHRRNGAYLRDAYIGDGPLKLFASDDLSTIPRGAIYLRSDDQERTVGSGTALVDGLFPPEHATHESAALDDLLTWHVADMANDHINTNDRICPMMGYISGKATYSPTFQHHIKDPATKHLEKGFHHLVGNFSWDTILECLSVARCNDLALPHGVNETWFTNVFQEVETRQGLYLTFNESWFAKVTMQPLIQEIVDRLDLVLNNTIDAPKLAITMGHDSTLMPLLAAIQRDKWDRKWTPYAGVLSMEVYTTKTHSHAIRMLFKGKPLEIPECTDTLCDVSEFLQAVEFARTPRNCTAPDDDDESTGWFWSRHHTVAQYLSSLLLIGLVAVCAFLGLRSRRLEHQRRRRDDDERAVLLT